jgi:hypothetical protein
MATTNYSSSVAMILNLSIDEEVEMVDAKQVEGKAPLADNDSISPAVSHSGDMDIEKAKTPKVEQATV